MLSPQSTNFIQLPRGLRLTVRFTDYDMMMALLRVYGRADRSLHIGNVIGRPYQEGDLEREMHEYGSFQIEERAQAMRCASELLEAGLLVPTYRDLSAPDQWIVITDAGRAALAHGAIDALDAALFALSPQFVDMRRGALRAANSTLPDTLRQAAHSGRELVSQVLKLVSSDEEVKKQHWYNPSKPDLVSRRDRYKTAILKRGRGWSESDLQIALKAGDLMEAQHVKLSATAHTREPIDRNGVLDALTTVDMVLRMLLV